MDTFLDWLTERFLDNVGYINSNAVGNLDIFANSLGAWNLSGDLFGNIFANFLGDLCTDRPLSPALFLSGKARMAFINHNRVANIYNLGCDLVFHDGDFVTFLFGDGGALLFLPDLGNILETFFTFLVAFCLKLDIRDLLGDFFTDLLTFCIIPKRKKLKIKLENSNGAE